VSQDVLGAGPAQRRPASRGRRRAGATLAAVLVAGSGIYLAGRADPDPAPPPTARTSAPAPPAATAVSLLDVAVGDREAYALIGSCLISPPELCTQTLLVSRGEGWADTGLELPARAATGGGLSARLALGGRLAVVEDEARIEYLVDGRDFARIPLSSGPAVRALPADGVLEYDYGRLLAFDPATGVRRPLARQPAVGELQAFARYGCRMVVVGERARTTVSTDCGATWTALPTPAVRPGWRTLRAATDGSGAVYLRVGGENHQDVAEEFTALWRYAGGRWTDVTPRSRPRSALSLIMYGGLALITEESGGLWRLQPDGTLLRMPDPRSEGEPVRMGWLVAGPTGRLVGAGLAADGWTALLSSADGGNTWDVLVPS
jgi:hypothetical protein